MDRLSIPGPYRDGQRRPSRYDPIATCQNVLHHMIDPANVCQDHVIMERTSDDSSGDRGGSSRQEDRWRCDGAHLIFPDPMGATGSSLSKVIQHYRSEVGCTPASIMTAHLIVTPEFIRNMKSEQPGGKFGHCDSIVGRALKRCFPCAPERIPAKAD